MRNVNEEMKNGLRHMVMALLAIVLLVGCSAESSTAEQPGTQPNGDVIVLGVSEVVAPTTRSQHTGVMDFGMLKTTGFGIYAYEGADAYNSASSVFNLLPANTQVTFEEGGTDPTTLLTIPGSWKYAATASELKEWQAGKKYTFFAYAPYMSTGEGTVGTDAGINTITTGGAGDPTITYTVATDPAESVDLLWGVRTAYTSGGTDYGAGLPWKNITKGQTTSAVLFTFYHALCAIGYHAQVMVDQTNDLDNLGDISTLGTIGSADGCKVTLKSITLEPDNTRSKAGLFYSNGVLNLNNTTAHQPLWTVTSGSLLSSLVLDGTKIDSQLLDPKTTDFSYSNPTNYDVMTNVAYDNEVPGITESANTQTVIAKDGSGKERFYMLIPYREACDYKLTIEYYLTYKTGTGAYHREAIRGTATLQDLMLEAGVKYYINLVFGLTTFKVSVTAQDWAETTEAVTIATETGTSASNSLAPRRQQKE